MTGKIDPLFANHPTILAMEKQTQDFIEGLRRDVRRPTFDSKCYQLAAHFISDVYQLSDTTKAEQYRCDLAAHIQVKIEDWIVDVVSQLPPGEAALSDTSHTRGGE